MHKIQWNLFRKTKELESKIGTFLANITEAGDVFAQALEAYYARGLDDAFHALKARVSFLEAQNDAIRRDVEVRLYTQMIVPGMRSDILALIEGCDKLINKYEENLILLSVEKNRIPKKLHPDLIMMTRTVIDCVRTLIRAVKNFFDGDAVTDLVHQTYRLEHQADDQAISLKQKIFAGAGTDLALRLQLKDFISNIEKISDMAEDAADTLSVISVKHAT